MTQKEEHSIDVDENDEMLPDPENRGKSFDMDIKENTSGSLVQHFSVIGFIVASSTLLVFNKLLVTAIQAPAFILCCQLSFSAVLTWVLGKMGMIQVDEIEWTKIRRFFIVPITFTMGIFSAMKILQHSNVETFIVFRAVSPIFTSFLDVLVFERDLPNWRSMGSILVVILGSVAYLYSEKSRLYADSMLWVVIWMVLFCFNQIYTGYVVNTVNMTSWGRVLYTNMIPVPLLVIVSLYLGEVDEVATQIGESMIGLLWLTITCILGTGISFFAYETRKFLTPTACTVVGNLSKAITVLMNLMIWSKHASFEGIVSLSVCIGAGAAYGEAPKVGSNRRNRIIAVMALVATSILYLVAGNLVVSSDSSNIDVVTTAEPSTPSNL